MLGGDRCTENTLIWELLRLEAGPSEPCLTTRSQRGSVLTGGGSACRIVSLVFLFKYANINYLLIHLLTVGTLDV